MMLPCLAETGNSVCWILFDFANHFLVPQNVVQQTQFSSVFFC